ncbi:hypothetical protein BKA66DRAFT_299534 [Pyrenochaeta sp. MPI-SDFR-AT-0127]|nr:hypothetical protein BKA66DRAFT_299534 [Pyrenochaeta sp. MPI-SDFR-AT-0127]
MYLHALHWTGCFQLAGLVRRLQAPGAYLNGSETPRPAEISQQQENWPKLGWCTFRSSGPMSPEAVTPITSRSLLLARSYAALGLPFRIRACQAGFQLTASSSMAPFPSA